MARKRDRSTFTRQLERFRRVRKSIIAELGNGPLDALEKGANEIADLSREMVPVETGKLKQSINVEANAKRTTQRISANALNPRNGVAYGQFAEFDPNFSKTGPKPFLYPAMAELKPKVREDIIESMREAIRKGADLAP